MIDRERLKRLWDWACVSLRMLAALTPTAIDDLAVKALGTDDVFEEIYQVLKRRGLVR